MRVSIYDFMVNYDVSEIVIYKNESARKQV